MRVTRQTLVRLGAAAVVGAAIGFQATTAGGVGDPTPGGSPDVKHSSPTAGPDVGHSSPSAGPDDASADSANAAATDGGGDGAAAASTAPVVVGPAWPVNKKVYAPKPERPDHPPIAARAEGVPSVVYGGPIAFGPYVSVQVNVNALGNNIPGDAANEPSIAIDPTDPQSIAIGWRQFDTVSSNFRQAGRAYSSDGGATWTFPGVLDPGQFRSDPVLSADAFGTLYYSSLSALDSVEVFRSTDGGISWAGPVNAYGGDKQWLIADRRSSGLGAGYIAQFWNVSFSCCQPNDFTRSINGALSFQSPIAVPPPSMKWGTMDVGPDGTLYLVGADLDQTAGHLFSRSGDAKNPAVLPSFDFVSSINLGGITGAFAGNDGPNPAGLLGQLWVVAHPTEAGRVYALASVAPPTTDPQEVMFVRSADGGESWSEPVRVNDDPAGTNAWQWFGTMSIAPNGRIDAIWNDTRTTGTPTDSAVFYAWSMDEGTTWSPNVQIAPVFNSHVGFPQQNKLGDYYHMLSDNGGANLAYAATFQGEQDVYFVRIPRDCNDNGMDDDCDTACGTAGSRCDVEGCGASDDCNGNAVPDECEPDDDCNENLVRDICEIGQDPDLDCNRNAVLDACEGTADCNSNGTTDLCDIANGDSPDCNENDVPDECDLAQGGSDDRDGDGVLDECEGACCGCTGCDTISLFACDLQDGVFSGPGTVCADVGKCPVGVPGNNHCTNAIVLPGEPSLELEFDNHCASGDPDAPGSVACPASQPFGADLWYHYVAPCTGILRVSMCEGTSFDAILAVYGGEKACECPTAGDVPIICGDDTCGVGGGPPVVELGVTEGRCYTIRAGGWNGSIGLGKLNLSYQSSCDAPPPLLPEPDGLEKNRFVSFVVPSDLPDEPLALRVRLTSLHHPLSPPDAPDFSAREGEYRYVNLFRNESNEPVFDCEGSLFETFKCARLSCVPEYRSWVAEVGGEVLHVTGDPIVPTSQYGISVLPQTCMGQEPTCDDASTPLTVFTAQWGDVDPGVLNTIDVAKVVDKIKGLATAPPEPHTLIEPSEPRPDRKHVNVLDLGFTVDALKGFPYPFEIAACP